MFPRRPKPTDKLSSRRHKFQSSAAEEENHVGSAELEFENGNEVLWLDDMDPGSISSEGSSGSVACTKHQSSSQQQPWDAEQVRLALIQLPAGETALSIISALHGEALEKALRDVRERDFSRYTLIDRNLSIPCFANGGIRKASLAAENDEAAVSEPGSVLAKWPETCLLVSCWLGQYELAKALLERGVNVSARDGDGRLARRPEF